MRWSRKKKSKENINRFSITIYIYIYTATIKLFQQKYKRDDLVSIDFFSSIGIKINFCSENNNRKIIIAGMFRLYGMVYPFQHISISKLYIPVSTKRMKNAE